MKTYGAVVRLPAGRDPVARITATPELAESQAPIRSLALTLQPDATPVPRDFSLPVPYPTPPSAGGTLSPVWTAAKVRSVPQGSWKGC